MVAARSALGCAAWQWICGELIVYFGEPFIRVARVVLLGDACIGMPQNCRHLGQLDSLIEEPHGHKMTKCVWCRGAQEGGFVGATVSFHGVGQGQGGVGHWDLGATPWRDETRLPVRPEPGRSGAVRGEL